jgi:lipopolysaccharide transport system permease protein
MTPVGDHKKPLLTIEPGASAIRQYAIDLWHHRDLVPVLAMRDIKLRYRQTALGAGWVILQPLFSAGILSFVFGRVAKLPSEGVPYFLFAFAGMMGWTAFATTLTRSSSSLVSQSALVSKIFFPRLILPLSTVFGALVDFVVTIALLVVLLVINDVSIGVRVVSMPVWLALLLMLALGVGFLLSGIAVTYRDVIQMTPVAVQFVLYATPVAYGTTAIPQRYQFMYHLNPIAALIEGFRWSLIGTAAPETGYAVYSCAFAVVVFFVGAIVLQKRERKFADVV